MRDTILSTQNRLLANRVKRKFAKSDDAENVRVLSPGVVSANGQIYDGDTGGQRSGSVIKAINVGSKAAAYYRAQTGTTGSTAGLTDEELKKLIDEQIQAALDGKDSIDRGTGGAPPDNGGGANPDNDYGENDNDILNDRIQWNSTGSGSGTTVPISIPGGAGGAKVGDIYLIVIAAKDASYGATAPTLMLNKYLDTTALYSGQYLEGVFYYGQVRAEDVGSTINITLVPRSGGYTPQWTYSAISVDWFCSFYSYKDKSIVSGSTINFPDFTCPHYAPILILYPVAVYGNAVASGSNTLVPSNTTHASTFFAYKIIRGQSPALSIGISALSGVALPAISTAFGFYWRI